MSGRRDEAVPWGQLAPYCDAGRMTERQLQHHRAETNRLVRELQEEFRVSSAEVRGSVARGTVVRGVSDVDVVVDLGDSDLSAQEAAAQLARRIGGTPLGRVLHVERGGVEMDVVFEGSGYSADHIAFFKDKYEREPLAKDLAVVAKRYLSRAGCRGVLKSLVLELLCVHVARGVPCRSRTLPARNLALDAAFAKLLSCLTKERFATLRVVWDREEWRGDTPVVLDPVRLAAEGVNLLESNGVRLRDLPALHEVAARALATAPVRGPERSRSRSLQ